MSRKAVGNDVALQSLPYESAGNGLAYQRLRLADGPVYFPDLCCDCLQPTDIRYTVRGNRLRSHTLEGAAIAGAMGLKTHILSSRSPSAIVAGELTCGAVRRGFGLGHSRGPASCSPWDHGSYLTQFGIHFTRAGPCGSASVQSSCSWDWSADCSYLAEWPTGSQNRRRRCA
jgi:hypothetical protein